MKPSAIAMQALHLPVKERAKLAQRLLESLDDLTEAEADKLWLAEAERRAKELDQGKVQPISAEELERRVRAQFLGANIQVLAVAPHRKRPGYWAGRL